MGKSYIISNQLKRIKADNPNNPIATYGVAPCRGYSVKNVGTTDLTLYINDIGFPIAVGDGMVTFGGFDNSFVNDQLYILFDTGIGDAIIVLSQITDVCDFDN